MVCVPVEGFAEGSEVDVTLEQYADRLSRMWAYYWAEMVPKAAEYRGYTREEMHEAWKYEFNSIHLVDKKTGEEIRTGGTTTRMTVDEQLAFVESCIRQCAENGIDIRPPRQPGQLDSHQATAPPPRGPGDYSEDV